MIWSINWDNCEEEKNSLIAAVNGRILVSDCGVIESTSDNDILSFTTRSILDKPILNWFWINSPTERTRRLPKWSISSNNPIRAIKLTRSSAVKSNAS